MLLHRMAEVRQYGAQIAMAARYRAMPGRRSPAVTYANQIAPVHGRQGIRLRDRQQVFMDLACEVIRGMGNTC